MTEKEERVRQNPFTVVRRTKTCVLTAFMALAGAAAWPAVAEAAPVATWPLAANANDTTGGHDGVAENVGFSGGSAFFSGVGSRITVPYSTALSPGAADVTATVQIKTTAVPGTGTDDFDLMRASPTGKMFKIELFPRNHVAQAQCVVIGTLTRTNLHAGPGLNDNQWHTITCTKTDSQVTLRVDNQLVGTTSIRIGSIALRKNAIFALGYKPVIGQPDQDRYKGRLRNASVSIG
jgi:concanavalin A-like lectin/glucanase superfamily protein